jgi:hypothetical protein
MYVYIGMDASHMSDYMEKINGPGHKMSPLQVHICIFIPICAYIHIYIYIYITWRRLMVRGIK